MKKYNYQTSIAPTWCPGCGNFGVLASLKNALQQLNFKPYEVVIVTDVGCAGNMADFISTFTFHALHGRALPPAVGVKLANHKLPVIAVIGDGACYGEGLQHFINLMRGNHDITVLVHDNYLYSLTTGQYSPTTPKGTITKSTPEGSIEEPLNPLALALANNTTFAARGYALDISGLTSLIVKAVGHQGFSFVDILQPCVTFNKNQTVDNWYKDKIYPLPKTFKDKTKAFKEALRQDKLATGIFWQEKKPSYHTQVSVLEKRTAVSKKIDEVDISRLLEEFI